MSASRPPLTRLRRRLRAEGGFTMLIVLGVLTVTMLLTAAVFVAVQGDTALTRGDLDGKRAYAAAQAGVQAYLYQLNTNSSNSAWWETCSNDTSGGTPGAPTQLPVPGTTTGVQYSFTPVPVAPYTQCSTSSPVASLIDPTTGTLRIAVTGYSGTGSSTATRTIVASFRTLSPLAFLWYTVYETKDSTLSGASNCAQFYYNNPSLAQDNNCAITWAPGDHMNGPMYTQDQFLVGAGNPASTEATFGRNSQDVIASQVPTTGTDDICASSNCQHDPNILGTREPNVSPQVPLPSRNSNLLTDATNHNGVYNGTLTLTISNTTASGFLCTGTTSSTCSAITPINLVTNPIIYATTVSGATCTGDSAHYAPDNVSYSQVTSSSSPVRGAYLGGCGDVYVTGTYSTPMTIASADDIVVTTGGFKNSTDVDGTTSPSGSATAGLVANQYVRVMHTCSGNPAVTIDAAILTLQHSFFVDNYDCGGAPSTYLSVHGAIAQYFRGIVALEGSGGYLKDYNYDDRLAVLLPPYLFDLQNTQWAVFRETLCSPNAAASSTNSCSYTGS